MILFGTQYDESQLSDQGYAMHGVALKQLNEALSDSKTCTTDDVLLSVVTLSLLECFVPSGPKNYLTHMIGLERLLDIRGPGSFDSPVSSKLLRDVRYMIIFASLRTGSSSILARTEWKTALRQTCTDEQIQEQDLLDILADCTVLISERDNMLVNWDLDPERGANERDKIWRRALSLLSHLHAWRKRWGSDGSNSYFETSAPPTPFAQMQPYFTVFEFSNDSAATMLMFYNTVLINVLQLLSSLPLQRLDENFVLKTAQDGGYPDGFWEHTPDKFIAAECTAALEICRCIPHYFFQNPSLTTGCPPVLHLAITTVWMTLRDLESEEKSWMTDILETKVRGLIAKGLWSSAKE
jgi:hypothetical protein